MIAVGTRDTSGISGSNWDLLPVQILNYERAGESSLIDFGEKYDGDKPVEPAEMLEFVKNFMNCCLFSFSKYRRTSFSWGERLGFIGHVHWMHPQFNVWDHIVPYTKTYL
jgi:hypothetical protein